MAEYSWSVVTFLDVLGFRELVSAWSADRASEVLVGLQALFAGSSEDLRSIAFSDSIVRARRIENTPSNAGSALSREIRALGLAQANAVLDGVLVRGAICVGDLYLEKGTVFGPGLVEAYDLESGVAKYPRIVVSPKALANLPASQNDAPLGNLLHQGDDGVWYVDYALVFARFTEELGENDELLAFLDAHRKLISENRSPGSLDSKALKYNWLTTYHNRFLRRLPHKSSIGLGRAMQDLVVEDGLLTSITDLTILPA